MIPLSAFAEINFKLFNDTNESADRWILVVSFFFFFFFGWISGIEKQKVTSNDPQNSFASLNSLNEKWVNLCRMLKCKFYSFSVERQTVDVWFHTYSW